MEKRLQEKKVTVWVHFLGHPYHSNVTKIHLDVALSLNEMNTKYINTYA